MEIELVARLTTKKLTEEVRRHLPKARLIRRGSQYPQYPSKAFICLDELVPGRSGVQDHPPPEQALHCALLLQLQRSLEYEIPAGLGVLVAGRDADGLARRVAKLTRSLTRVPQQKIVSVRRFSRELEVLFLDDAAFRMPLDDRNDWDRVSIDKDRLSLSVPRDGESVTIPWDAIRDPACHIDEAQRTKRAIAATLRTLRGRAGLTQREVAERAQLDRQTVVRLERGGHYPGLQTLRKLALACGVTLQELLADLQPSIDGAE